MKFIDNQGITDPRINLAIEEYALHHLPADDDYLLFYHSSREDSRFQVLHRLT